MFIIENSNWKLALLLKNFLFLLALLCVLDKLSAQVKSENGGVRFPSDNMIPPSPNVASLSRFGQYPVDYSTGLPQISIPLYTIATPQLTLPISLSYHASGVRVDEIPGWAGLSWSLLTGGAISVTVKGLPDLNSTRTSLTASYFDSQGTTESAAINLLSAISAGLTDSESDIYNYTVPGKISGTFTYSKSGKIVEFPRTDNKIIKTTDGFTIVAEDGVTYLFNSLEMSYNPSGYVSAYNLTKIIAADKQDEISFRYTKTPEKYYDDFISTCLWKGSDCSDAEITAGVPQPLMHLTESYPNVGSTVGYDELLLAEITFTGGKVLFEAEAGRLDKRKYRLKSMQVIQDESNKVLQEISFQHGYFDALGGDKRLRLEGVEITGNKQEKNNYKFFYNNETLPGYFNRYNTLNGYFGQDKWGYFNGVTTNEHFFGSDFGVANLWRELSVRTPSERYRKAGTLEKIIYPTGGYTIFQMESNLDNNGEILGGLRIRQMTSFDSECKLADTKSFEYEPAGTQLPVGSNDYQYYTYTQGYERYLERQIGPSIIASVIQSTKTFYVSNPVMPAGLQGGPQILYSKVTEHTKVGNQDNGKVEYIYDCTPNEFYYTPQNTIASSILPRYKRYLKDKFWQRGQQLEERIYRKKDLGYELVKKTTHEYNAFADSDEIIGTISNCGLMVTNVEAFKTNFWWFDVKASTGFKKLSRTSVIDYINGNEASVSSRDFSYEKSGNAVNSHLFITAASSVNSKGEELLTRYKYPPDLLVDGNSQDARVIKSMCDANMISNPVEEVSYIRKNGGGYMATKGSLLRYNFFNGLVKPWQILSLENKEPFAYDGVLLNGSTGLALIDKYKVKTTFNLYNTKGKLLEAIGSDGVTKSYLWGYKYSYPVAKADGANYSQLKTALGKQSENDDLASIAAMSTPQLSSTLGSLRTGLMQVNPQSLLATYTYDYFIGCIAETNVSGISQYYDYDGMGRLESVKDDAGAILKAYKYNYAGTANNCTENREGSGVYYNDEKSETFTKDDCNAGMVGRDYAYLVPEKKYLSVISKEDANNLALAEINRFGQKWANIYASCYTPGMVTLMFSNSTNYPAVVQMTHSSGQVYGFTLQPTNGKRIAAGEIKEGFYTGSVTTQSPGTCNFMVYYQTAYGAKAIYFSNLNFCQSCAVITIN